MKKELGIRCLYGFVLSVVLLSFGCKEEKVTGKEVAFYQSELFKTVQLKGIFEDSKTFTDLVPNTSYAEVITRYEEEKDQENFSLRDFVANNFSDQSMAVLRFKTDTTRNMYEHISSIWDKLKRGPDEASKNSSRIPLPNEYIVPGGRFQEIYYWDSYFTLEGLLLDGEEDIAMAMVDNFSHLIDSLGFIPNGTRDYYLTRSQPPFYSLMVAAVTRRDTTRIQNYLPYLLKEYHFWTEGKNAVKADFDAVDYVVRLPGDIVLNRYYDRGEEPRPEAYKEDTHLASGISGEEGKKKLYRNLRAAACSGWDFSSRWYTVDGDFSSTATTEIIPVDLNSLLYFMENLIARGYRIKGDKSGETTFLQRAKTRKDAIINLLWDSGEKYFMDYNFKTQELTGELTLAGTFPLYFKIATVQQAADVRNVIMQQFLKPGGLVTTLKHTGQQWDAPNGWAPLQWIAVNGLLNYGYEEEAGLIMQRWLSLNEKVYENTGKMMEKYNVEDLSLSSGGGEYPTQDGFGWTNGVALGFKELLQKTNSAKAE